MIWIFVVIFNLLIGIFVGVFVMSYRNRNLLKNQKILCNELQNNKTKLNEYQKRLNNHFDYNIELLNKIAEHYRNLYQNMTKDANFFIPNTYHQDDMYVFHQNNKYDQDKDSLPTMEVPLDYSDNTKVLRKNYDTK